MHVCVSQCRCVRWSAVSEFGQKVNNYSAYSVIMVPVSLAAGEEGAPSRLSSSVMKYRHRGALYTWIFINTGLTVMRPEQVGWDTHIRVRSIRQEAVGKTSGRSSPCRNTSLQRAEAAHPHLPSATSDSKQLNVFLLCSSNMCVSHKEFRLNSINHPISKVCMKFYILWKMLSFCKYMITNLNELEVVNS